MHGDYLKVTETTIQENSTSEDLFAMLPALMLQAQQSSTTASSTTDGLTKANKITQAGNGSRFLPV